MNRAKNRARAFPLGKYPEGCIAQLTLLLLLFALISCRHRHGALHIEAQPPYLSLINSVYHLFGNLLVHIYKRKTLVQLYAAHHTARHAGFIGYGPNYILRGKAGIFTSA